MKRPAGIVILALVLAWLCVAGLFNAYVIFMGDMPPLGSDVAVMALAYSIAALAASIGLLGMKPWGLKALHAWMLICLVIVVMFSLKFEEFSQGGIMGLVGIVVFVGLLFLGIHRYVRSKFAAID